MKFVFIVQGEGRGHLTQALALYDILVDRGHEISHVIVGKSVQRKIPRYFFDNINAPVSRIESPNFIWDSENKALNFRRSITTNLKKINIFLSGVRKIHQLISTCQPDVIINFYEVLAGVYGLLYRPKTPLICIGHQYLFFHPQFRFPPRHFLDRCSAKIVTQVTLMGSSKVLALSLYPLKKVKRRNLVVIPPLIRKKVLELKPEKCNDFYLVYILNSGYSKEIIAWHDHNQLLPTHCFWDKTDAPEVWNYNDFLTFHTLDDKKFLTMMSQCKNFITTAGFESICEACYLRKSVFCIPVRQHYDQIVNAYDIQENAKLGLSSNNFHFEKIVSSMTAFNPNYDKFHAWFKEGRSIMLKEIEQTS